MRSRLRATLRVSEPHWCLPRPSPTQSGHIPVEGFDTRRQGSGARSATGAADRLLGLTAHSLFSGAPHLPICGCMPVFDTYSRRKRRAEQGEPDVHQYDHVSDELRAQVLHILNAAIPEDRQWWDSVHNQLLREK
jgi:hypothetical protein